MAYDGFTALRAHVTGGVARATIDHPPINLLDLALVAELEPVSRPELLNPFHTMLERYRTMPKVTVAKSELDFPGLVARAVADRSAEAAA